MTLLQLVSESRSENKTSLITRYTNIKKRQEKWGGTLALCRNSKSKSFSFFFSFFLYFCYHFRCLPPSTHTPSSPHPLSLSFCTLTTTSLPHFFHIFAILPLLPCTLLIHSHYGRNNRVPSVPTKPHHHIGTRSFTQAWSIFRCITVA